MNVKAMGDLKPGEIEITWTNGHTEKIQTSGQAYNSGAIVCEIPATKTRAVTKLVIPMSAIKHFRVRAI